MPEALQAEILHALVAKPCKRSITSLLPGL